MSIRYIICGYPQNIFYYPFVMLNEVKHLFLIKVWILRFTQNDKMSNIMLGYFQSLYSPYISIFQSEYYPSLCQQVTEHFY